MCIGCRTRRKKEEMIRFTQTAEGIAIPDGDRKPDARGFYLCPGPTCLKMAKKKNRFRQIVEMNLSEKSVLNK
jgi:predicted RNA-binding protein YlxR (DUF448 family)